MTAVGSPPEIVPPPSIAENPRAAGKQKELTLDALAAALATPGEHRLFRWGKLPGLFPNRAGASALAATAAVRGGLLETTRTEAKGRLIVEWVRATPAAVGYVAAHDSPAAVLRELKEVLGATQAAIPEWMLQTRDETAQLAMRFEHNARAMLMRLEALTERVEAALRRAEIAPPALSEPLTNLVPWGLTALAYLDRRIGMTSSACSLADLFAAVRGEWPDLVLPAFQNGLRRLHDMRAVRLITDAATTALEPEYAFVVDGMMVGAVRR